MPGDDQERFEAYLELERFLIELRAGKATRFPQQLTPDQARIYHMALLFHAATPDASELSPTFAACLRVRLEDELFAMQQRHRSILLCSSRIAPKKQHISRRKLLAGGTVVAASAVVGAGGDRIAEQVTQKGEPLTPGETTEWFFVTTVAELGNQAVPFSSAHLIGYVVRSNGTNDPATRGQILALSAACTHRGCLVQWSGTDRTFRCPCHGGVFTEDGQVDAQASTWLSLRPLPRLAVKVEKGGEIYVRMPGRQPSPE